MVDRGDPKQGRDSGNRLLDALRRECRGLRGLGERMTLASGTQIVGPGQPISHVWFPTDGVLSTMIHVESGESAEVFSVGSEGMAGLDVWQGVGSSFGELVTQASGEVIRIPAKDFCDALNGARARRLLQGFTNYALRFSHQNAVCNALHSVEQRTARWILTVADRTGASTIVITHEQLAERMGVRRQSVGEVAVGLQRDGAIAYRRSDVTIVDRALLERRSCECYRVTREAYRRVVEPLL